MGSSPLSRGIPNRPRRRTQRRRIIPALAGNTRKRLLALNQAADHPRSRGEYFMSAMALSIAFGSSPLSRGIPSTDIVDGSRFGIIPALAGNTFIGCWGLLIHGDHPRSRGEYRPMSDPFVSPMGSSPLSRGIQSDGDCAGERLRIIPALAGNTDNGAILTFKDSDHPRSRGEYNPHTVD